MRTLYHGRRATLAGIKPTRVLVDSKTGYAVDPKQYEDVNGEPIVIVFVRDDGWSLAARESVQELAGTLWDYRGYWRPAYHDDRGGVALHGYAMDPNELDDEVIFEFVEYPSGWRVIGEVKTDPYDTCEILLGRYADNSRVAIELYGAKGSRFAGQKITSVSANVPEAELYPGEFCVRDYDLSSLMPYLSKCDLFEPAERAGRPITVPSGFVRKPVWRLK